MVRPPAASDMRTVRFKSKCSTTLRRLVVAMTSEENGMTGWSLVWAKWKYHNDKIINSTNVDVANSSYWRVTKVNMFHWWPHHDTITIFCPNIFFTVPWRRVRAPTSFGRRNITRRKKGNEETSDKQDKSSSFQRRRRQLWWVWRRRRNRKKKDNKMNTCELLTLLELSSRKSTVLVLYEALVDVCDYLQEMSPHKVSFYVERKILTRLLKLQAKSNERKTVTWIR